MRWVNGSDDVRVGKLIVIHFVALLYVAMHIIYIETVRKFSKVSSDLRNVFEV